MQFLTIASAALAALPIVSAGKANVYNKCEFDVTAWSVSSARGASKAITIKAGDQYSEDYVPTLTAGGGVSIKLTNDTKVNGVPNTHITQFEYTDDGTIWYDMSNVDCTGSSCPFAAHGWYMDASDSSCPTRSCAPDAAECTGAYIKWNDDINTLSCAVEKDINLYLCATEKPSEDDEPSYTPPTTPVQAAQVDNAPEQESSPVVQDVAPVVDTPPTPAAPETPVATVYEFKNSLVGTVLSADMFQKEKREESARGQRRHVHHARHPHARPMM